MPVGRKFGVGEFRCRKDLGNGPDVRNDPHVEKQGQRG